MPNLPPLLGAACRAAFFLAAPSFLAPAVFCAQEAPPPAAAPIALTVHADRAIKRIDPMIYGQFLEHIFNSVHGGLWGDQILNGTLEPRDRNFDGRPRRNNNNNAGEAGGFPAPAYWETFGPAQFRNDPVNSLNSDVSLRIITHEGLGGPATPPTPPPDAPVSGIRQKNISLKKDERYTLTLYLRSATTATARLRFDDAQGAALFTRDVPVASAYWQKFTFDFTPAQAADAAVFSVASLGEGDLSVDQISLFSASALATGGYRPDLLQAVSDLHPAAIRWPGGTFANTYIWENGVGPVEKRVSHPVEIWNDRDPNQFGTDEFMRLCEKIHASPVIVLNTRRGVAENLAWLEYCLGDAATTEGGKRRAANGHPAPYPLDVVEIDNEAWLMMDKPRYLDIVHRFSAALREKYPRLRLSVCGSYAYDDGKGEGIPANANWDQTMLDEAAKEFDILSPHYYNGLLDKLDVNNPREYEKQLLSIGERIKKSANPNVKLYVSEWNPMTTDWRTGLYAGGILNVFERQSDLVVLSCPALFLRRTWARSWDNALVNFDQKGWFPAPNYVVMKLWRDHFAPNLLALDGGAEASSLNAVATKSEDGATVYLKAVNTVAAPAEIVVALDGGFTPAAAEMQVVAPGAESARNTLEHPDAVRVETAPVTLEGGRAKFTLPPQSVGVLTLKRS